MLSLSNQGLFFKKEEYRVQKREILICWKERSPFRDASMFTMETSTLQTYEDGTNQYKRMFQNAARR